MQVQCYAGTSMSDVASRSAFKSEAEPELELERHRALLEVSEAIALHRDLPALFHDLARLLPRVVGFDTFNLGLYIPERHLMRLHIVETERNVGEIEGLELPVEESPGGRAWRTQESIILSGQEMAEQFPRL